MIKINEDGFLIEFNDKAIEAFKFDTQDSHSQYFHGLNHTMKAVDVIAEFPEEYLFIEMKDYSEADTSHFRCPYQSKKIKDFCEQADESSKLKKICSDIRSKFYETFLYRYAERKVDKPISCITLVKLDSAMLDRLNIQLKSQIPIDKASPRWKTELFRKLLVVNPESWNELFAEKYGKCS